MTGQRVAIVTGGASGLGRALCLELARDNIRVIVADRNEQEAQATVQLIQAQGQQASARQLDVSMADQIEKLIDHVVSTHGQIDFVFNNAGIALAGDAIDMTVEQWRQMIDVNLGGVLTGTMAAYRVMARQGFGHIVNVASVAGLVPMPVSAAYAMTKHAIVGLSSSLRIEAERYGVRISTVCPGFVATNIFRDGQGTGDVPFQPVAAPGLRFAISPDRAARLTLRGVKKNRGLIVFPLHGRLIHLCQKFAPWIGTFVGRKMVDHFHRLREHTAQSDRSQKVL